MDHSRSTKAPRIPMPSRQDSARTWPAKKWPTFATPASLNSQPDQCTILWNITRNHTSASHPIVCTARPERCISTKATQKGCNFTTTATAQKWTTISEADDPYKGRQTGRVIIKITRISIIQYSFTPRQNFHFDATRAQALSEFRSSERETRLNKSSKKYHFLYKSI